MDNFIVPHILIKLNISNSPVINNSKPSSLLIAILKEFDNFRPKRSINPLSSNKNFNFNGFTSKQIDGP